MEALADQLAQLSAQNGQMILLKEVLQWATQNKSSIAPGALMDLLTIAARYGA